MGELGELTLSGDRTALRLRCDAACVERCQGPDRVLLLSVAGPESSVKALAAVLRSKNAVAVELSVPGFHSYRPQRDEAGYDVYRVRLGLGYWHALVVSRAEGFIPALSDESLWQELRKDRCTTPVLRSWVPWLRREMAGAGLLGGLEQAGCECGLLKATDHNLDRLVSHGLKTGALKIRG